MLPRPTLGFIGAGRVGQTLSRLWYARGYTVAAGPAVHSVRLKFALARFQRLP